MSKNAVRLAEWTLVAVTLGVASAQPVAVPGPNRTFFTGGPALNRVSSSGETLWSSSPAAIGGAEIRAIASDERTSVVYGLAAGRNGVVLATFRAADGALLKTLPLRAMPTYALAVDAQGNVVAADSGELDVWNPDLTQIVDRKAVDGGRLAGLGGSGQVRMALNGFDGHVHVRPLDGSWDADLGAGEAKALSVDEFGNSFVAGTIAARVSVHGEIVWKMRPDASADWVLIGDHGMLLMRAAESLAAYDAGSGTLVEREQVTASALSAHSALVYSYRLTQKFAMAPRTSCITNPVVSDLSDNPASTTNLRAAVTNACPGSTITFSVTGTITLTSRILLNANVTIQGPGASNLTISGGNSTRIFFVGTGTTSPFSGNVSISGVTLANGRGSGYEGSGGSAGMGGAIFLNGGTLQLTNVIFSSNAAAGAPGDPGDPGGGGFGGPNSSLQGGSGGDLGGSGGPNYNNGNGGNGGPGGGGGEGFPGNGGNGGFAGGGGFGSSAGGNGGFGGGGASGDTGGGLGTFGGANGNEGYGAPGAGFGGAIFAYTGTLRMANVTFSNNSATGGSSFGQRGDGRGGAIFIYSGAQALGSGVTFTGSVAAQAGTNTQSGLDYNGNPRGNPGAVLECPGQDTVDICGAITTLNVTIVDGGGNAFPNGFEYGTGPSGGMDAGFSVPVNNALDPGNYLVVSRTDGSDPHTTSCSSVAQGDTVLTLGTPFVSGSYVQVTFPFPASRRYKFLVCAVNRSNPSNSIVSTSGGLSLTADVASPIFISSPNLVSVSVQQNSNGAAITEGSVVTTSVQNIALSLNMFPENFGTSNIKLLSGTIGGSGCNSTGTTVPGLFGFYGISTILYQVGTDPESTMNLPQGAYRFIACGTMYGSNGVGLNAPIGSNGVPGAGADLVVDFTVAVPPAAVSIVTGNLQQAALNTSFATPLSVRVTASDGSALVNQQVTFTTPSSGPSGTFPGGLTSATVYTDSNGLATAPTLTAYGQNGQFQVTATAGAASTTFLLVSGCLSNLAVTDLSDSSSNSLRVAVLAACDGSTISFSGAASSGTLTLASRILINKSLTIQGPGASNLTISGGNATRIFFVGSGSTAAFSGKVSISGLTLANGYAKGGNTTYNFGGGGAGMGGAIFQNGGLLEIANVSFTGNVAQGGNDGANVYSQGGGGFAGDANPSGAGGSGGDLGSAGMGGNGPGGNGGFGAGGGGNGGSGPGGNGGFGGGQGNGVPTGNGGFGGGQGGGAGGGAGMGGAIFAYTGTLQLTNVSFTSNQAIGGLPSRGANGDGRGGALFIYTGAQALGSSLTFSGSVAAQAGANTHSGLDYNGNPSTSNGAVLQCPGQDTVDVCGLVSPSLSATVLDATNNPIPNGILYGSGDGAFDVGFSLPVNNSLDPGNYLLVTRTDGQDPKTGSCTSVDATDTVESVASPIIAGGYTKVPFTLPPGTRFKFFICATNRANPANSIATSPGGAPLLNDVASPIFGSRPILSITGVAANSSSGTSIPEGGLLTSGPTALYANTNTPAGTLGTVLLLTGSISGAGCSSTGTSVAGNASISGNAIVYQPSQTLAPGSYRLVVCANTVGGNGAPLGSAQGGNGVPGAGVDFVRNFSVGSAYTDVTSSVSVTSTGLILNRVKKQDTETITITNRSGQTISGPIEIVMLGLPQGVSGANNTALFQGNPYWTATASSLTPGAAVQVSIILNNPNLGGVTATTAVYSGSLQ